MEEYPYVRLFEDTIRRNSDGTIAHHPLDGSYTRGKGRGLLTFRPPKIENYALFPDVKVYSVLLNNQGLLEDDEREAWADPIRVEILKRLSLDKFHWYISANGGMPDPTQDSGFLRLDHLWLETFVSKRDAESVTTPSDTIYGTSMERSFFEVDKKDFDRLIAKYFQYAFPGHPIQGYQLPPSQIKLMHEWSTLPRDDQLLRQVIDTCPLAFYTMPAEHKDLDFVTNKYSRSEMEKMLNIAQLQQMAVEILENHSGDVE